MLGHWVGWDGEDDTMFVSDRRILRSLSHFDLSGTRTLAITTYEPPSTAVWIENSAPHHVLSRMENLRTLTLIQCNNLPFILALNPDQNQSMRVLCPKLEELVLYVEKLESSNIEELVNMAKGRASVCRALSLITIVGLGELIPEEVFKLEEYVARVDHRVGKTQPVWDSIPGDGND